MKQVHRLSKSTSKASESRVEPSGRVSPLNRNRKHLEPLDDDIVSFLSRGRTGVLAHRVSVTHLLDKTDGDTVSLTMLLTDESIEEVNSYLGKKEYYISDTGNLAFSADTDILSATLAYLT